MAYPFPIIEHQVYKKTFLRDVRVLMEFSSADFSLVDKTKIEEFFSQFSGADVEIDRFLQDKSVTILSEPRNLEFRFDVNKVEAKICTPLYSSFEPAMPYWKTLTGYMEMLDVREVTHLTVRKYSSLYFQSDLADYDVRKVMDEVFCKDLMKMFSSSYTNLNSIEKSWSMEDDETGTAFNAVFGIKKSDTADKNDRLTLTTSLESREKLFDVTGVLEVAKDYNKILFDAFHWCVKEDILKEMK